jgi:Flp pilus assembly pilin Flp
MSQTFLCSEGGAVFVEYVVLLSVVSMVLVFALVGLGIPLLNLFLFQQAVVLMPIP